MRAVLVAHLLVTCIAIDDEFPGFYHFKNTLGHFSLNRYFDGSNTPFSQNVIGYACDDDYDCMFYNSKPQRSLFSAAYDSSVDSYLSNTTCGGNTKSAICASSPEYIVCVDDYIVQTVASYNLPPEQIASACMRNPSCIGFSVLNDRSAGTLYSYQTSDSGPAFLKLRQKIFRGHVNSTF